LFCKSYPLFYYLDGVNPARTAEAVVVITIVDISDHGPKFPQSSYNASIFENVVVDTTILTVKATDNDLVCFECHFFFLLLD
jgi:hypothetical protein